MKLQSLNKNLCNWGPTSVMKKMVDVIFCSIRSYKMYSELAPCFLYAGITAPSLFSMSTPHL